MSLWSLTIEYYHIKISNGAFSRKVCTLNELHIIDGKRYVIGTRQVQGADGPSSELYFQLLGRTGVEAIYTSQLSETDTRFPLEWCVKIVIAILSQEHAGCNTGAHDVCVRVAGMIKKAGLKIDTDDLARVIYTQLPKRLKFPHS